MPNRCFTAYVIEGDHEELKDLYSKLKSLADRPSEPSMGFKSRWLGDVVEVFEGSVDNVSCRGKFDNLIYDNTLADHVIRFDTMTAWGELNGVWDLVMNHYETLSYYWRAEEPGNAYYATNDAGGRHFPERYLIDEVNVGVEYYETEGEVLNDLSGIIGIEIGSWEEVEPIVNEYNESHEDDMVAVIKFDIVNKA